MKSVKIWAVLGPSEGLGPATIKYLLSRNQPVIALEHSDPTSLCDALKAFTDRYGLIDILLDNLAYGLIDDLENKNADQLETRIQKSLLDALYTIKLILPYMAPYPEAKIIGMRPKSCILMQSGEPLYDERPMQWASIVPDWRTSC